MRPRSLSRWVNGCRVHGRSSWRLGRLNRGRQGAGAHSSMRVSRDLPRKRGGWSEAGGLRASGTGGASRRAGVERTERWAGRRQAGWPVEPTGRPGQSGAPNRACRCPGICRGNVGGGPPAGPPAPRPVLKPTPVPKRGNAVPSSYGRVLKTRLRRGPGPLPGWPPGAAGCPGRGDRRCATHSRRPEASFRVLGHHRGPKNGS